MEEKSINYNPKGSAEVFHISQNDSNRQIRCNLYDDSSVLNVTSSDNVRVRYKKPDKSIGSFGVSHTGTKSYVDVTIPNTLSDKAGLVYCKLRINGNACKSFFVAVEEKP